MDITTEISAWQDGRADCLAREATQGNSSRWGEEIQGYDDEATRLLDQATPLIQAVEQLMELHVDMWFHNATSFSCSEVDAISTLLTITHDADTAHALLVEHATDDDCGDGHWHLNPDSANNDDEDAR